METILHNPRLRAVKIPGGLSACVAAASGKAESGHGNGDCLVLDLARSFFALSDASERHPRASREFLGRVHAALGSGPGPRDEGSFRGLLDACYREQPYGRTATFCGLFVAESEGAKSALLACGGDSFLAVLDSLTGEILFRTPADMSFAGRSLSVGLVTRIPLPTGRERIILATDGLADLSRVLGLAPQALCGQYAALHPPDEAADRLARFLNRRAGTLHHDDLALIVLDPFALTPFPGPVIYLGGTARSAERRFRESLPALPDEWRPLSFQTPS